jgi:hypothetical protein
MNFNTTGCEKGWVAFPTSIGSQKFPTYITWQDTKVAFNGGVLPASTLYVVNLLDPQLFTQSVVPGVTINGITHTYSLYLFNYGSAQTNFIEFKS